MEESAGITTSYCGEKIFLRKNVLTQYTDLLREVDEVERRIHKTEAELRKIIDEGEVTDVVRGGEGGIQHYTITGFPQRDYNRMRILLNTRKSILHSLKSEIEQSINDVQEFINGIENSHDRRIVTMRVIDRMSWRQIAINMGGNNTEEGVRQTYHRLIERSEA